MTPTTLGELRAAVARVLVARGEAADALVCSAVHGRERGKPRVRCSIWPPTGNHPLEVYAVADDEGTAIADAWALLVGSLGAEWERADDARVAAERALSQARAALAAAREAGE